MVEVQVRAMLSSRLLLRAMWDVLLRLLQVLHEGAHHARSVLKESVLALSWSHPLVVVDVVELLLLVVTSHVLLVLVIHRLYVLDLGWLAKVHDYCLL
jgi:hypothetical protein